jgi:hypothetical protein
MGTDTAEQLLRTLQENLEPLREKLAVLEDEWVGEDLVYRFWHQSFKVYMLQGYTESVVKMLRELAPTERGLHPWFEEIVEAGTGHRFEMSHNKEWTQHTLPIVHAFFHARHMLSLTVRCAEEMEGVSPFISSRFATVLELYQIR